MIEGVVNSSYEAVIPLSLQGPAGQTEQVEAVIDTSFTGFLTLPPSLVAELGLVFKGTSEARGLWLTEAECRLTPTTQRCSGKATRESY